MNFSSPILGASIVVLAITQPALILALEPTQVNEIAKNITVRIEIENGTNTDHGSGVIIARDNSRYYVLSAKHVVKYLDYGYTIVAPDGASYQLDNSTIKYADDVDLAVVAFESDRNYKVALIRLV